MNHCRFSLIPLLILLLTLGTSTANAASYPFRFQLGFAAIANLLLADNIALAPLDNEAHNPQNGDGIQHALSINAGKQLLLVWRKADNWTAATDGYYTWVNGPTGLQKRLNTDRFSYEANPDGLPVTSAIPLAPNGGTGEITPQNYASILAKYEQLHRPAMPNPMIPTAHPITLEVQGITIDRQILARHPIIDFRPQLWLSHSPAGDGSGFATAGERGPISLASDQRSVVVSIRTDPQAPSGQYATVVMAVDAAHPFIIIAPVPIGAIYNGSPAKAAEVYRTSSAAEAYNAIDYVSNQGDGVLFKQNNDGSWILSLRWSGPPE